MKTCCFIGHRVIEITDSLIRRLKVLIEALIVCDNVGIFLFGSNSEFNDIALEIVTDLQKKYPHIKRIAYGCKSEAFFLEKDKEHWQKVLHCGVMTYDSTFDHKNKMIAGKASYIERNQAMIDNSDFCVFYYDEDYLPKKRKQAKKYTSLYQPQSGTKLAYLYAVQKRKKIFNLFFENIN